MHRANTDEMKDAQCLPFATGPGAPGADTAMVIVVDCGDDVYHFARDFAAVAFLAVRPVRTLRTWGMC
jgi:hypothetical protein